MAAPVAAASGGAPPAPADIERAIGEILAGGNYDLREPTGWAINTDWMDYWQDKFFDVLDKILDPIRAFLEWLQNLSTFAYYSVLTVAIVILAALLFHIVYTFYKALQRRRVTAYEPPVHEAPNLQAIATEAGQLAATGNYVDASRQLYRGALLFLEFKRGGRLRLGLTNEEYVNSFKTPWIREALSIFAHLIDFKWYRDQSFDVRDYQLCLQAFRTLEQGLAEDS